MRKVDAGEVYSGAPPTPLPDAGMCGRRKPPNPAKR
jgi:hypothetical protein